jgi:hypothetical protein
LTPVRQCAAVRRQCAGTLLFVSASSVPCAVWKTAHTRRTQTRTGSTEISQCAAGALNQLREGTNYD